MKFIFLFLMLISTAQADIVTDFENHIGGNGGTNQAEYNTGSHSEVKIKIPKRPSTVPLPGAIWLFGTGLVGCLYVNKKNRK